MFLIEPNPSPADLKWRMLGTDVRVHPSFWLMTAVLGWSLADPQRGGNLGHLLLWILVVFVSILIHEFGHVVAGRMFGSPGHIVLYSFGGLAVGSNNLSNRWQRIIVSFAGPLAQFIVYGLVLLGAQRLLSDADTAIDSNPLLLRAVDFLLFVNLYWPLFNLLPIWPLDGGQIARETLTWFMPRKGLVASLGLSALCSGAIAVYFLNKQQFFNALLFGMFALSAFQMLQQVNESRQPWDEDRSEPWERERTNWDREDEDWRR